MIRAIQPLLTLLLLLLFATILTNAYPDQCNCDLAIAVGTNFGVRNNIYLYLYQVYK